MRRRRLLGGIFLGAMGVAMAGGVSWAVSAWRWRSELDRAIREMDAGHHRQARQGLSRLAVRWPGQAEVEFRLGICEMETGRLEEALACWERVPGRSPLAARAALYREQAALALGRFSVAEEALLGAESEPDPLGSEAGRRLARLLRFQGRIDEVARRIEADWDRATDRAALLVERAALDLEALPVEVVRTVLEKAGRDAPDDDRVWLGRANLAIRVGQFADANRWLDACRARRPDDPPIWKARLAWSLATEQVDAARQAVLHLPSGDLTPDRVLALRAWLAARRDDPGSERASLEELVGRDPGAIAALERLAEIAIQAGDADRAASLRRRKAELDRAKRLYRSLITGGEGEARAAELARLAEALGRRFEARGWWALVTRRSPADPEARAGLARLARDEDRPLLPGQAPSDLLAAFGPATPGSPSSPLSEPAGPPPDFVDDAEPARLRFTYDNGKTILRQIPETMGGGVGLLDYDGDGWLDVYAVQGGPFPVDPDSNKDGDRLFRNRRDGTFEDVTHRTGIADFPRGYGHGVAVGDYDDDGHADLFITRFGSYALYRNRGDGRFEDVTIAAGLGGDRDWPTSAAFADLDGDGDLDLYVCHYLRWDARDPRICREPETQAYMYCVPHILETVPDHLFRNEGGRFIDVTAEAGLIDRDGPGLGVVAADLDDDGLVDLFVANDGSANFLFRNSGGFRFEETAMEAGVASNAQGGFQSGMGVACGDLDDDGRADLVVTNFYGEATTFYQNLGGGLFADSTASVGLLAASRYLLGFGIAFLDYNNDGRLDVATANGHVNDFRPKFPYAMPAQLLAGGARGRLTDVSDRAGSPWQVPRVGRGLAAGDLDNDGRIDVLLLGQNEPLAFLRNRTAGGHFVTFHLEGTHSHRDAVGARVAITAGGRRRVARRVGGGSYQSSGDPRIHFGLGPIALVESVEVRWPSGRVDHFANLPADTGYDLREGDPTPRPLVGFQERP